MNGVEARVESPQRLAKGAVQGVDRAVPVRRRVEDLTVHGDLDGRLGAKVSPLPGFDQDGEIDQPKGGRVPGLVAPDEQLEGSLGALERETLRLELLDQQAQLARVHALQRMAELLGTPLGV